MKYDPAIFTAEHQLAYEKQLRERDGIKEKKESIQKQMGSALTLAYILSTLGVLMLIFGTRESFMMNMFIVILAWVGYWQKVLELKSIMHLEFYIEKNTEPVDTDNPCNPPENPKKQLAD
mgnify:CR=1 FL=1